MSTTIPTKFTLDAFEKGVDLLKGARRMNPGQKQIGSFDDWLTCTGHVPVRLETLIRELNKKLLPVVKSNHDIRTYIKANGLESAVARLGKCWLKAEADQSSR